MSVDGRRQDRNLATCLPDVFLQEEPRRSIRYRSAFQFGDTTSLQQRQSAPISAADPAAAILRCLRVGATRAPRKATGPSQRVWIGLWSTRRRRAPPVQDVLILAAGGRPRTRPGCPAGGLDASRRATRGPLERALHSRRAVHSTVIRAFCVVDAAATAGDRWWHRVGRRSEPFSNRSATAHSAERRRIIARRPLADVAATESRP